LVVVGFIIWNINWSLLSSSPLAFWDDGAWGLIVSLNTRCDKGGIICEISWCAEVVIWNQTFTVTPHALVTWSFAISLSLVDAVLPVTLSGF
jgi:hypothetical protein